VAGPPPGGRGGGGRGGNEHRTMSWGGGGGGACPAAREGQWRAFCPCGLTAPAWPGQGYSLPHSHRARFSYKGLAARRLRQTKKLHFPMSLNLVRDFCTTRYSWSETPGGGAWGEFGPGGRVGGCAGGPRTAGGKKGTWHPGHRGPPEGEIFPAAFARTLAVRVPILAAPAGLGVGVSGGARDRAGAGTWARRGSPSGGRSRCGGDGGQLWEWSSSRSSGGGSGSLFSGRRHRHGGGPTKNRSVSCGAPGPPGPPRRGLL